jgi:hypothetical protein
MSADAALGKHLCQRLYESDARVQHMACYRRLSIPCKTASEESSAEWRTSIENALSLILGRTTQLSGFVQRRTSWRCTSLSYLRPSFCELVRYLRVLCVVRRR